MKDFLKKNYGKIIVILVFIFISLFIVFNKSEEKRSTEDRIIKDVIVEKEKAYIAFYSDEWTYVVYENNGVDLSIFEDFKDGDDVTITFEPTKSKREYHIIYVMVKDDVELFNLNEYYRLNDIFTKNVFLGLSISIIITMLIFFVIEAFYKDKENTSDSFIIKSSNAVYFGSPRRGIEFFLFFIIVPLLTSIYGSIISILIGFSSEALLGLVIIPLFFEVLGLFGLIVCIVEKFEFNGSEYIYRHFYGKTEKIALKDIGYVSIVQKSSKNVFFKVVIYDKESIKRISFNDNGLSLAGGYFMESLTKNNIKINTDCKYLIPKNPEDVKKYFESIKDNDEKISLLIDIVDDKYIELSQIIKKADLECILDYYEEDDGSIYYELGISNKQPNKKNSYFCLLFYSEEWLLALNYDDEKNVDEYSKNDIVELIINDINEYIIKTKK